MKRRTFLAGLFVTCSVCICHAAAAAPPPAAPPAGYNIDEEYTVKSPDGATTIEQYLNKEDADGDWKWQFWVRRGGDFTLLDPEPALYPADFVFTADLNWIIRVQKIGSGTMTLHLYHLTPQGYVRASKKPLGDLAWDFMKSRPDWKKLLKAPEYHDSAYMLKGLKENYKDYGVDWPANRYLLIGLSADADVKGRKPMQTLVVNGWHCRYDLQTGKFDVPPIFVSDNAKAVMAKSPGDD
jgi:hypothetical protein